MVLVIYDGPLPYPKSLVLALNFYLNNTSLLALIRWHGKHVRRVGKSERSLFQPIYLTDIATLYIWQLLSL